MKRIIIILAAVVLWGCESIKDDLDWCPPEEDNTLKKAELVERMIVYPFDPVQNRNIPTEGNVTDGSLFIFDSNKKLIAHFVVPDEELCKEKLIPLPEGAANPGDVIYLSAWANIENNMDAIDDYYIGQDMDEHFLKLDPNPDISGFSAPSTGEIYFGLHQIVVGQADLKDKVEQQDNVTTIIHQVPIEPITARLNITVVGLPAGAKDEDYYFEIYELNGGYDFKGEIMADGSDDEIQEQGRFDDKGHFITAHPPYLVPSAAGEITEENVMHLRLWQNVPGGGNTRSDDNDIDLAGEITKDREGNLIDLNKGQTTNVLIRFDGDGNPLDNGDGIDPANIEVTVVITPWNEIYQWSIWE